MRACWTTAAYGGFFLIRCPDCQRRFARFWQTPRIPDDLTAAVTLPTSARSYFDAWLAGLNLPGQESGLFDRKVDVVGDRAKHDSRTTHSLQVYRLLQAIERQNT